MKKKIAIRKKILLIRKKKYFNIPSNFFNPLIKILKKKKKNKIKILSLYYPSNFEVSINKSEILKYLNGLFWKGKILTLFLRLLSFI